MLETPRLSGFQLCPLSRRAPATAGQQLLEDAALWDLFLRLSSERCSGLLPDVRSPARVCGLPGTEASGRTRAFLQVNLEERSISVGREPLSLQTLPSHASLWSGGRVQAKGGASRHGEGPFPPGTWRGHGK